MKRFHVHLGVPDLSASIRFYSGLFGQAPTVQKDDYAKWMLDDPRVNFAISQRGRDAGVNHLGLQAESADELAGIRAQFEAADAKATVAEPGAQLLLREIGQALGDRSAGNRLGGVSHAGFDSAVRIGHRGSKSCGELLLTEFNVRIDARQSGQRLGRVLLTRPRYARSRLQRAVPLHRQLRAQHHGRVDPDAGRRRPLPRLQRRLATDAAR